MGHYRSEMGFEDRDRKNAEAREERLKRITKKIKKEIDQKGIARVIAEVVTDRYYSLHNGF